MTALTTGAAAFLARAEGAAPRLPGADLPWLAQLRAEAALAFRGQGFPNRRVEAWKYTDLAAAMQAAFGEPLSRSESLPALPPALHPRAVFVDGHFRPDLSSLAGLAFPVAGLAASLPSLADRLGAVASPIGHPLVALNAMLFEDGLVIDLPAGLAGGVIELLSVATEAERAPTFHPRHLLRLGAGATLTLIERAIGPATRYLHNPVFEIEVAEGARLNHGRLQAEGRDALFLSSVSARVAAGGTYDNFSLIAGARLSRNEIHVALVGAGAAAHMNGAQLIGNGQHADTTTTLDHAAPGCPSRQTYKSVLAGRSRGVFQGKILVRQVAQKTDGYQMNQALLLSEEAEIDAKPQLEIYADDVKCSHGATVGALDPEQLFFLRARGIPKAVAESMLVEAFLTEAVDAIEDEAIREAFAGVVPGWWQGAR